MINSKHHYSKAVLNSSKDLTSLQYVHKKYIESILQGRSDYILTGASAIIMEDLMYVPMVKDVDIIVANDHGRHGRIDAIPLSHADETLPIGYKDRTVLINGVRCLGKYDLVFSCVYGIARSSHLYKRRRLELLLNDLTPEDFKNIRNLQMPREIKPICLFLREIEKRGGM